MSTYTSLIGSAAKWMIWPDFHTKISNAPLNFDTWLCMQVCLAYTFCAIDIMKVTQDVLKSLNSVM